MTSNVISVWHPPSADPAPATSANSVSGAASAAVILAGSERKGSAPSVLARAIPPPALVSALEGLYLGENNLADESLHVLMILRELRVLNLSFNAIQEMPRAFFREMTKLEELYVSGNKLAGLPTEDLQRLKRLRTLFLNGNRMVTLPQELGKVKNLMMLDVGSNQLKYNISNWEFDWNWNFNKSLRYLNLSGNKRLEIKPARKISSSVQAPASLALEELAGFTGLTQLRVLGLMDVTTTFVTHGSAIPDDNEDRRVRTSLSEVNDMMYGIADNLGAGPEYDPGMDFDLTRSSTMTMTTTTDPADSYVQMFDLVVPGFRDTRDEALFAMFGRARAPQANSRVAKFLRDGFAAVFADALARLDPDPARGEGVPDALRRAFLTLNWRAHDFLFSAGPQQVSSQAQQGRKNSGGSAYSAPMSVSAPSAVASSSSSSGPIPDTADVGASGIVAYVAGRTLYVANAGNALAVVSRRGHAEPVSAKHDPFERAEIERIRAAEGWVSPKGLVNDDAAVSRAFGFYHLVPVVNAKPDVFRYELADGDEFVIVANEGLWDFVSFQTAVDIARTEKDDPMIAAQKLRDFAISYGARGATMIMVISVAPHRADGEPAIPRARKHEIARKFARLPEEVDPPVGHIALVFTDIRNSTHLWETNAGMPTAMKMHHELLRRELRVMSGYEVKTEGDAFMVAFDSVAAALLWCMTVQTRLLEEPWPREILESRDGRERRDADGNVVARGLSVRMGVHFGSPVCETDITTHRMDYYGPMVNRTSRISEQAKGGQIMVSADAVAEIRAILDPIPSDDGTGGGTGGSEGAEVEADYAYAELRKFRVKVIPVGTKKLKGIEMAETLALVYPEKLLARHELADEDGEREREKVRDDALCTSAQVRELAAIGARLQALAGGRILRAPPSSPQEKAANPVFLYADPATLRPALSDNAGEAEILAALEFVMMGLEASTDALVRRTVFPELEGLLRFVHLRPHDVDREVVGRIARELSASCELGAP